MCLGGIISPKVWKCALTNEHHIVTMYADEVDPHRTHQYTNLAMGVRADELQGPVQRLTLRGGREHRVPVPEPRLYPAACDRCGIQQAKARWSNKSHSAFVKRGPMTSPRMVDKSLRLVHEIVKECVEDAYLYVYEHIYIYIYIYIHIITQSCQHRGS